MKIVIETIPHAEQRYETVGDWWLEDDPRWPKDDARRVLQVRVSNMGDPNYEVLVAIHEFAEAVLCGKHGVKQAAVDAFDLAYKGDDELGDDPAAPYHAEHCFATAVERMMCAAMGIAWAEYDEAVSAL